jgi:hypothetical protein
MRGGRNEMADLTRDLNIDILSHQQYSTYTSERKKCLSRKHHYMGWMKYYVIEHPALFNIYFEEEKMEAQETRFNGIGINRGDVNMLRFSDDIAIITLKAIDQYFLEYTMSITKMKTKILESECCSLNMRTMIGASWFQLLILRVLSS